MKTKIIRIVLTLIALGAAIFVTNKWDLPMWQDLLIYLVPYLIISYDVLGEALEGILHAEPFEENLLMAIATVGAMCIGFLPGMEPQFAEAVAVMLFFQIGEMFEHFAEHRSRRAISHLLEIRPDHATVLRDGQETVVSPEEVNVGEEILVRAGEKVPLDGTVTDGTSTLDTSALTGESVPRPVGVGEEVLSGCMNGGGLLRVRVEKHASESTVTQIIRLVESATERKSRSETFIRKFARVYTPLVVVLALLVAFVPPLFGDSYSSAFPVWLGRALTFLVVSCPCALVVSVPLTFFAGIGGASRRGILIKGSSFMEPLSKAHTVVFDKTGTVTYGSFEVMAVHPQHIDTEELIHLAAHVERHSTHPISVALRMAYPDEADECSVEKSEEVPGCGVCALVQGKRVCVGNERMMEAEGATCKPCSMQGTIVHVCIDGVYAGHVVIADRVKPDAKKAMTALQEAGVEQTVMLTGDQQAVADVVAAEVGVGEVHAQLLPQDKVAQMQRIRQEMPEGRSLLFVGDGINDAPVLAAADVGLAMGALGSDAAIEAADVVLMDDKLTKIPLAIRLARRTIGIARQNILFAIGVKTAVLVLATIGLASMWMAVFADVGVMVLCVLNAMRALASK